MDNIELRINGQLTDTGRNFGVRLNRTLLNPAELNTKDAQYSYSVTLPLTNTNDAIFSYASVEETKAKFNRIYDAELIINSYRIFKGRFRMSEINEDGYKGNLVIPVNKSVKDIFGESKLTENPPLLIEFKDFAEYINFWNNKAKIEPQPCVFPYVLYGVLPKSSVSADGNTYTGRNLWDSTVMPITPQSIPPSINPLKMLKHIFESRGYTLIGSAFEDSRLASLYMSYKNESDYVQPWNYGRQAYMKLAGSWNNIDWDNSKFEKSCYTNDSEGQTYYTGDLFNGTQNNVTVKEDTGANILQTETKDKNGFWWKQTQLMVPLSGFYKIRLKGNLYIDNRENWRRTDPVTGVQFVGGDASNDSNANSFYKKRYELKLLRDFGTADFGLSNARINRRYYRENLNQNDTWNEENTPKYFPQQTYSDSGKEKEIMFIDPAENPNLILGMCWGERHNISDISPFRPSNRDSDYGTVLAAKTGFSWDVKVNGTEPTKLAIPSIGYLKWGRLGQFNDEDENPNTDIDYSGGDRINDKALTDEGIIEGDEPGSVILNRFALLKQSLYTLEVPEGSNYEGNIYLFRSSTSLEPYKIIPFTNGVTRFDTYGVGFLDPAPRLTLYLKKGDEFDVDGTLVINRVYDPEDIIDWENTNKFKISMNDAPESYARRGWYKGQRKNNYWYGDGETNAIVWLNSGELLTLAVSSDLGRYKRHNSSGKYGWTNQALDFELDIAPYRIDEDWIKVNSAGNGTSVMNWNDPINFQTDEIDLVKFLPNGVRTDEFIDNFCKAFNLKLSQSDLNAFTLDIKQAKKVVSNNSVDLDERASVLHKTNQPLGLPSAYSIGFTIDTEEEGYVKTEDNGGGVFYTGAIEEKVLEQKSTFSFNWFKEISKTEGASLIKIPIPIISKSEVWTNELAYPEAMKKGYTNLAQRFWYYDGLLNDLGASFKFGAGNNAQSIQLAKVSNALPGLSELSYKDEVRTILNNYFSILVNADSHYTIVECYLRPDEYEKLDGSYMVRFNGDYYYVADVDGYDPLGRNMCKIKLIRKI